MGSAQDVVEEAVPFLPHVGSIQSRFSLGDLQKWYQIRKSHLDQLGYFEGTPVVIDISKEVTRKLEIGDVVIANKGLANGCLQIILRQFIPPSLLVTNSRNNVPILNLYKDDVAIFGKVICAAISDLPLARA